LRKQAVDVAYRLAGLLREQDRDREAIEVLNRLLRIDLANASAHRDLMVLLAREGRRSDALRQYQEFAAALSRELDAEPGAEKTAARRDPAGPIPVRRGRNYGYRRSVVLGTSGVTHSAVVPLGNCVLCRRRSGQGGSAEGLRPSLETARFKPSTGYTEAIAAATASLQLRNDDIDPMLFLIAANVAQGDLDEAQQIAAKLKQLDPTFRLTEFSATQPYRNPQDLERLIGRLREAGLPD
jgi:tetratricopeptide (TPR) repeat protein